MLKAGGPSERGPLFHFYASEGTRFYFGAILLCISRTVAHHVPTCCGT